MNAITIAVSLISVYNRLGGVCSAGPEVSGASGDRQERLASNVPNVFARGSMTIVVGCEAGRRSTSSTLVSLGRVTVGSAVVDHSDSLGLAMRRERVQSTASLERSCECSVPLFERGEHGALLRDAELALPQQILQLVVEGIARPRRVC